MNATNYSVSLGAMAALVLTMIGPARADECLFQMGPYTSQSTAEVGVRQARNVGFKTSSIWGEGDAPSQLANNKYFFNVFIACR
jgi:hypothetical protein